MKCTNQVQRYDPTISYIELPPKEDCGGEMIEVGHTGGFKFKEFTTEPIKLYQCESCKSCVLK